MSSELSLIPEIPSKYLNMLNNGCVFYLN